VIDSTARMALKLRKTPSPHISLWRYNFNMIGVVKSCRGKIRTLQVNKKVDKKPK